MEPAVATSEELLEEWGFAELIPHFREKGIDYEVLKNLTADDLNRLISDEKFGLRVKFRAKLFEWKNANNLNSSFTVLDSVPNITTIENWVTASGDNLSSIPIGTPSSSTSFLSLQRNDNLDLIHLLNSSITGKSILRNYEQFGFLCKKDRQDLCSLICEFWINRGKQVLVSDYAEAVQRIISIFPKEEKTTYLGYNNCRGSLKERFYTLCKKYRRAGHIHSRYNLARNIVKGASDHEDLTDENGDNTDCVNCQADFEWLQKNVQPESLVLAKWNATYPIRKQRISNSTENVFEKWPILKQKFAPSLIELDFERLYPGKSALLFLKWKTFFEKTSSILRREIKDQKNKKLIQFLEISEEDTKDFLLIHLLNAHLVPQIIKKTKGKKQWKPTISDAQDSFALHVTDKNLIYSTINQKKAECLVRKSSVQPFIIVVGDDFLSLREFYIFFNDVLYPVSNMLKGVSVTFQLHQVLNIEYANECNQVWLLLEDYIYEIPISGKITPDLSALLGNLKE